MNRRRRAIGAITAISLVAAIAAAGDAPPAPVPTTADSLRGGWVADVDGVRHVFVLKLRGSTVTGIYCAVDCGDPARLRFVDGRLTADGGVRFELLRVDGRRQTRTYVVGRLADGRLSLTLDSRGARTGEPSKLDLQRDPRKPALVTVEELFKRRGVTSGSLVIAGHTTPYEPATPNEPLTPAVLEGLWVWGNGSGKQHFMFRQVGDRLLGAVCGPCDNPYTFGVLDDFAIRGDTLTFGIVHEDWGIGIEFGPFVNHATATLSRHELHLRTVENAGPRTVEGDLVLTGPLRTQAP